MSLLEVRGVSKAFRGVHAVDECSLSLEEGGTLGLIGPNGAGKSTLVEIVCGGIEPDRGRVLLDDVDVTGWSRARLAQQGVVRSFQIPRLLGQVAVLENAMLARQGQRGESLWASMVRRLWRKEEEELAVRAVGELAEVGLAGEALAQTNTLSGGQSKLLEVGRSLVANPRLLVLDEPVAGVHPRLMGELVEAMRELKERGITILIVEHNLTFVDRVCDSVAVMVDGNVLVRGSLAEIREDRRVVEAYLGRPPG